MALETVYLGQTFQATTVFQSFTADPIVPTNPAQYTVLDFNNNRVVSGVGAQDTQNPNLWRANITIPESAPASKNNKYSIQWTLRSDQGNFSSSEYFSVLAPQAYDIVESDNVFLAGSIISDAILFPAEQTVGNISISLTDSSGTVINTQPVNVQPFVQDGQQIFSIAIDGGDELSAALKPYMVAWFYTVNGQPRNEFHFLYVVGPKTIYYMEQLRNFIDKIRFSHPNPRLRFNDVDLIGYLIQGVQIINGTKPIVTSFLLETVPQQFEWYLLNAAAWVGLSAQYLAEGVQAFDFNGQTVSLTVDRTQYYDAALGRIQSVLETDLVATKTMFAKSSARPVLGLSPSPSLNRRFVGLYLYGNGGDLSFLLGNRADAYINSVELFLS